MTTRHSGLSIPSLDAVFAVGDSDWVVFIWDNRIPDGESIAEYEFSVSSNFEVVSDNRLNDYVYEGVSYSHALAVAVVDSSLITNGVDRDPMITCKVTLSSGQVYSRSVSVPVGFI